MSDNVISLEKLVSMEGKVICEIMELPETTEAGIIIPEEARRTNDRGIVSAVTEGSSLKVGDIAYYGQLMGGTLQIKHDGKTYHAVREENIFAVIRKVEQ